MSIETTTSSTHPFPAGKAASDATSPCVDENSTWDQLVRDHAGRIYRHAYSLTRNRQDAEDLTQDVFCRVFRGLKTSTPENFEGWLYRITVNLFRDHLRHRRLIRFEQLPAGDAVRYLSHPGPEDAMSAQGFDDDVRCALAELHPGTQAAVLLYAVDGLTYEEIAVTLRIKRTTVATRIHRGRAHLRATLAHRTPHDSRPKLGLVIDTMLTTAGS